MKTPALTGIATLALAVGAFAQGIITVDDSNSNYGVTTFASQANGGSLYSGTYGLEVWALSPLPSGAALTALLAGINISPPSYLGVDAYGAMIGDGFLLEAGYSGKTMVGGAIQLGTLTLPSVNVVGGSPVVLGLALWTGTATSFSAAIGLSGVLAFLQATAPPPPYLGPPPIPPDLTTGQNSVGSDLVMAIPEPGTLALAGLGVAALLIFRRRPGRCL